MLAAMGLPDAADNLGFLLERGHGQGFLGPPFAFGSARILAPLQEAGRFSRSKDE